MTATGAIHSAVEAGFGGTLDWSTFRVYWGVTSGPGFAFYEASSPFFTLRGRVYEDRTQCEEIEAVCPLDLGDTVAAYRCAAVVVRGFEFDASRPMPYQGKAVSVSLDPCRRFVTCRAKIAFGCTGDCVGRRSIGEYEVAVRIFFTVVLSERHPLRTEVIRSGELESKARTWMPPPNAVMRTSNRAIGFSAIEDECARVGGGAGSAIMVRKLATFLNWDGNESALEFNASNASPWSYAMACGTRCELVEVDSSIPLTVVQRSREKAT